MTGTAADYTVSNSSINEPTTYAHVGIMPSSINEPLTPIPTKPVLTTLVPNTAVSGSGNLTMHVIGSGFGDYTMLSINGVNRVPTFVSVTELTTVIRPSVWGKGTYPVKVANGEYSSKALGFTFT